MAAQSSPRKTPAAASVVRDHASNNHSSNQHAAHANGKPKSTALSADFTRRKSVVSDPEEMLLLREKLNQIAVGLQFGSTPHDDDCEDEEDEEQSERQRQRQHGCGHFKVFPLLGERPSTPPSSPQPRDVLRKQMRLRNSSFRLDDLPSHRRGAGFNDFDDALDGVCVDAVEVTRYNNNTQSTSVRLSIPGHLRVRSASSFSVLTKNPEGLRKRKSSHVDDKDQDGGDATPLKKVSSQKNILAPSTWDYDAVAAATGVLSNQTQHHASQKDHEMEDVSPESPDSVIFVGEMGKHHGRDDMSTPCS